MEGITLMSDSVTGPSSNDTTFQAIVNKSATRDEIPREEIAEAMKSTKMAYVKIMRRNDKGTLAYCERKMRDLVDLLAPEEWLREQYGGGRYRFEVFPPEEMHRYLVPPFQVTIEGLPKPINRAPPVGYMPDGTAVMMTSSGPVAVAAQQVPQLVAGYGTQVQQSPGAEQPMTTPPFLPAGYNPALAAAMAQQQQMYQPPPHNGSATMAADQALAQQLEVLRAETERDRAEAKALATKLEERMLAKDEEIRRMRETLDEERRKAEQDRHRIELEALKTQMTLMAQPKQDDGSKMEGYAKMLAAVAPVLAAMAGSGKESSKLVAESTMEAQKAQMQMVTSLMSFVAQGSQRPSEMTTMMPMLLKMMEQKGPEAQAALISTMAENSMSQMAMMAQFVQAMAAQGGDGPPWWLPMVEKGLQGAVDTIGGIVALRDVQKQQVPGVPAARGLPAQQQAVQARVVSQRTATDAPAPAAQDVYETQGAPTTPTNGAAHTSPPPAPTPQPGPDPRVVTKMVMARLPEDMRRPEWESIIYAIHAQAAPTEIAERMIAALDHFQRFDMVPESLAPVFEHPRETLSALLAQLPVNSYAPDYGVSVVETVVRAFAEYQQQLREAEEAEQEPQQDDAEADAEAPAAPEALVTPAPTQAS